MKEFEKWWIKDGNKIPNPEDDENCWKYYECAYDAWRAALEWVQRISENEHPDIVSGYIEQELNNNQSNNSSDSNTNQNKT